MASKSLVIMGDIELHHLAEKHILPFVQNMSKQNLREFEVLYKLDPVDSLRGAINEDLAHAVELNGRPIAICGVRDATMWAVFSNDIKRHWRSFVKGSPSVVRFYHNFHDELYCDVWDENIFVHNWLAHLGFLPYATQQEEYRVVNFVRCNSWNDVVGSSLSRPVMH